MTNIETTSDIRQFKLTNGEEILCEVIQWQEEEEVEILIRKAMRLIMTENEEGVKYYAFRPWMVYQEGSEDIIIINSTHIVGLGYPTNSLLVQWNEAVKDMEEMYDAREREHDEKYGDDPEDMVTTTDNHSEMMYGDSSSNNIIQFDSKKLH